MRLILMGEIGLGWLVRPMVMFCKLGFIEKEILLHFFIKMS